MIDAFHSFFMSFIRKPTSYSMFSAETNICFWLVAAFFFLILEMGHPGLFFFLSFFFGGLSAAFATLATDSIITQIIIFFAGTLVSLCLLRYWGVAILGRNRPHQHTNFYALRGKRAIVTQTIVPEKGGLVNLDGQVWAARSNNQGETILSGDVIEVVDVRGAHVVVKKI